MIANRKSIYRIIADYNYYIDTAAHEMGHVLGLKDAYSVGGVDRCADNPETCLKIQDDDKNYQYFNLMKSHSLEEVRIRSNDIEMMLYAYSLSEHGNPRDAMQYYKDLSETAKISDVIINREDEKYEFY